MISRLVSRLLALSIAIAVAAFAAPLIAAPSSVPDREILVMVRQPPEHLRPDSSYGGSYDSILAKSARGHLARRIAHSYRLRLIDSWPMPMIGMDCFVMAVTDSRTTAAAADQVSHDRDVAWSEPVSLYQTQSSPASDNDPLYRAEPAAEQWKLADLHRMATGRGVRIAVIDSGIEDSHPDLAGQVAVNRNFVSGRDLTAEAHGTGVAGIIAAKANNGLGIAGVAPDAKLLGLRACWQSGTAASGPTVCDSFSLAKALYFAAESKADVINLSLSGPDDRLLRELLKAAMERGSTVVAAFDSKRRDGGFPASLPGVIAVADSLLPARTPVYTAPGRDVPTTEPGARWFLVSGSSYSAAHVSGLAALIRQRRPDTNLSLVASRSNGGVIDACATLLKAAGSCDCACDRSNEKPLR